MRTAFVIALILCLSRVALAQDYAEYRNTQDGFKVLFPGQPTMTTTTWKSQQGYVLPAHLYAVEKGREHYSVLVADYTNIEQMAKDYVKTCPPGAPVCNGNDLTGIGYWKHDTRGAVINAVFRFTQRDAKLTDLLWSQHDLVEGYELQLTNNSDQSRTYAYVTMHEMKLYIVEATVPKGYPPATLFQTSMGWVDKDGNPIRYATMYNNEFHGMQPRLYPLPAHAGAAGGGRAAGAAPPAQGQGNTGR
jgi:hypothetical protein